ncbi:hypothetical protein BGX34_007210 [Mortierella sp. NVP85]|nr:hypothetical protein BGX34_007210 [Mortierella sp. NVP85]
MSDPKNVKMHDEPPPSVASDPNIDAQLQATTRGDQDVHGSFKPCNRAGPQGVLFEARPVKKPSKNGKLDKGKSKATADDQTVEPAEVDLVLDAVHQRNNIFSTSTPQSTSNDPQPMDPGAIQHHHNVNLILATFPQEVPVKKKTSRPVPDSTVISEVGFDRGGPSDMDVEEDNSQDDVSSEETINADVLRVEEPAVNLREASLATLLQRLNPDRIDEMYQVYEKVDQSRDVIRTFITSVSFSSAGLRRTGRMHRISKRELTLSLSRWLTSITEGCPASTIGRGTATWTGQQAAHPL